MSLFRQGQVRTGLVLAGPNPDSPPGRDQAQRKFELGRTGLTRLMKLVLCTVLSLAQTTA